MPFAKAMQELLETVLAQELRGYQARDCAFESEAAELRVD
jgi:hypothetical protein